MSFKHTRTTIRYGRFSAATTALLCLGQVACSSSVRIDPDAATLPEADTQAAVGYADAALDAARTQPPDARLETSTARASDAAIDTGWPDLEVTTLSALAQQGELAPLCGERLSGGLNAPIPVRGVTPHPGERVRAYAYDWGRAVWALLGETFAEQIPIARVDGLPVFGFDLGSACTGPDCDLLLPLWSFGGFGPYDVRLRIESQWDGLLHTHCVLADGEACDEVEPMGIRVIVDRVDAR